MTDSSGRAPRVLIVAPNASSIFGGESFLPLQYFRILRRRGYPVRLVTHSRNRPDLETTLGPDLGAVSFVEDTAAHRLVWRIGSRFPAVIREVIFDRALDALDAMYLSGIVRRLVAAGHVEVIHQPTPVSPLAPSGLHRFGVPLVLGPMNGGMNYPLGYDDLESPRARRFVAWSRRLAWLLNRVTPGKRRAAVLLVANERTRAALPFPGHPDIRVLVENGVDLATWGARASASGPEGPEGRLRLVFMGRLIPWKMVDLTLQAVRAARREGAEVTLDILGDGPERPRLERLARDWGLEGAVRFHGFLPQATCAQRMAEADALILNSVRECGGAVVLEAMAARLPVIASDWGGPADYVDDGCGILVSPVPRESFAARLGEAILRLARDPVLRREMGEAGARKIVEQFDWERKVDRMTSLYAEVAMAAPTARSAGRSGAGPAVPEGDAG